MAAEVWGNTSASLCLLLWLLAKEKRLTGPISRAPNRPRVWVHGEMAHTGWPMALQWGIFLPMQQKGWGQVGPQDRPAFFITLVLIVTGVHRHSDHSGLAAGMHAMWREKLRLHLELLTLSFRAPFTNELCGLELRAFSQVKLNALCFPICRSPLTSVYSVLSGTT